MYDEIKEKSFVIVDDLLLKIINSKSAISFSTGGKGEPYKYAKRLLVTHKLVSFADPTKDFTLVHIEQNGLEVSKNGGIKKYLVSIQEKKEQDIVRQERKDKSDEIDLKLKQWTYKAKYFPFIFSGLALIVSVCAYFKPEKKQIDLQPMQQKIQELQVRVQLLDSLHREDTLPKKHN